MRFYAPLTQRSRGLCGCVALICRLVRSRHPRYNGRNSFPARSLPKVKTKKVVMVAPHFPPSNLTCVHRTRLFAGHLAKFGYEPTVLCVDPRYYEEPLEPALADLLPPSLPVIRTRALPIRPLRLFGDLGLRSFYFHYRAIAKLVAAGNVDLLFLPIPPNYSCLLGPLVWKSFRIPYVIDYIDPWVYPITDEEKKSWKARVSHWLARRLEPLALRHVGAITAVASGYYKEVLERHPHLRSLPNVGIPYGFEKSDHEAAVRKGEDSRLLLGSSLRGKKVLVYAGAILPRARGTVRTLFEACRALREQNPTVAAEIRLLFVGTGMSIGDAESGILGSMAAECGVGDMVEEIAERQPYLEVLSALHGAHAVLVLGSSERHYTASKIFQSVGSERPVLALLHEASTAAGILREMPGVELVLFSEQAPVETKKATIVEGLARVAAYAGSAIPRPASRLDAYSAYRMTADLAACFDQVLKNANPHHSRSRDSGSAQVLRGN